MSTDNKNIDEVTVNDAEVKSENVVANADDKSTKSTTSKAAKTLDTNTKVAETKSVKTADSKDTKSEDSNSASKQPVKESNNDDKKTTPTEVKVAGDGTSKNINNPKSTTNTSERSSQKVSTTSKSTTVLELNRPVTLYHLPRSESGYTTVSGIVYVTGSKVGDYLPVCCRVHGKVGSVKGYILAAN